MGCKLVSTITNCCHHNKSLGCGLEDCRGERRFLWWASPLFFSLLLSGVSVLNNILLSLCDSFQGHRSAKNFENHPSPPNKKDTLTLPAEGMALAFGGRKRCVLPLLWFFFGFGLVVVNSTFIHGSKTNKKIFFISFKQFQIARGQSASDAFVLKERKKKDPPCANLGEPEFFCQETLTWETQSLGYQMT